MRFGVCYYPEQWPASRWPADAAQMRAAGIDIVRIAEFAWAVMEPADGQLTWAWLDEAVTVLAEAGLQIVLGTPTAAPPAWLTRAHPQVLRLDADGRSRAHGTRRHYCPSSPLYRRFCRRIVTAMARRYGSHPAVIAWQLDNEFGGGGSARCYCDRCAAAWRDWLARRYGDLDSLNLAWGTVFWSQQVTAWDQIAPPDNRVDKKNPSQMLDYYRFASDTYLSFQQEQLAIIQEHAPGRPVTHNFMGLFADLDQHDLARPLSFASWDNYPTGNPERWRRHLYPPGVDAGGNDPTYAYDVGDPLITGLAHAVTLGLKQAPFWVMEQQCGQINWGQVNSGVRPGTPRLWAWHAVAAGADTLVYFRWRATLFAQEQYHSGLRRHDGRPDVGWEDQLRLQAERDLLDRVAAAPAAADVALLFDFDDLWALALQPHRADFDYQRLVYVYFSALQRLGIPVHVVSSGADLRPYRLLIAPCLHLVDEEKAGRLARRVSQGSTLLLGVRSGFKTRSNLVTDRPLPGPLQALAGAQVSDWQSLPPAVSWSLASKVPGLAGPATYWVESLQPQTANVLAAYAHGPAALTENRVGDGRALYLGWYPDAAQAAALLQHLAAQLDIRPAAAVLPPGMVLARRGPHTILLNFTDRPLAAQVGAAEITVPGRDVRVVTAASDPAAA